MDILIYVALFFAGVLAGAIIGYFVHYWLVSQQTWSGTIFVNRFPDKTVFSLELDEDPEELAYKPLVIFKVKTFEVEDDRE